MPPRTASPPRSPGGSPRRSPRRSHRLLTPTRRRYLLLGLLLRLSLLLFGLYQDAHSPLPYTDIDYSVFLSGAHHLVHGCPLSAAAPPRAEPMEELSELRSPPLAPMNGCAQGWLAVGARYILQHEEILVLRSRAAAVGADTTPAQKGAHEALQGLQADSALSYMPPSRIETALLPLCLAVLRPILRPLATMGNPYARPTYRYTPLLAALLAPGAWMGGTAEKLWGKGLFVLADVLAAVLMWDVAGVCLRARRRRRTGSIVKAEGEPSAGQDESQQAPIPAQSAPAPASSSASASSSAPGSPLRQALRNARTLPIASDPTHAVGVLWLLNPFPAQIATRGSSEAVLSVLVLGFLAAGVRLVQGEPEQEVSPEPEEEEPFEEEQKQEQEQEQEKRQDDDDEDAAQAQPQPQPQPAPSHPHHLTLLPALPAHTILAPLLLALAAHLKLFPALYGFSVLAALLLKGGSREARHGSLHNARPGSLSGASGPRWADAFAFTAMSLYAFLGLGLLAWAVWGRPFLDESLLYHVARTDHRHNFSPYFLPLYLGGGPGSGLAGLAAFLPQLAVVLTLALRLAPHSLPLACAAQTLAFVTWNKVATSQYFVWYIQFLPVFLPFLDFSSPSSSGGGGRGRSSTSDAAGTKPGRDTATASRLTSKWKPLLLPLAWASTQALWLGAAYALEFQARDVFPLVWAAGLGFFGVNCWVGVEVVRAWFRGVGRGVGR